MTGLRFDDKVVVVTGAGGGIGRAHALAFAERGARVVVNDLGGDVNGAHPDDTPAHRVVAEITALGGEAVADVHSVIPPEGGQAIIDTALETWGRLDVLVNNAGVLGEPDGIEEVSDAKIDSVLAVHVRGAFSVIRPAWRAMSERGGGHIVNTSSGSVFGIASGASYQAAKAAVLGLTRNLALQGVSCGIKVNALLPTAYSRMTSTIKDDALRLFMEQRFTPERVAQFAVLMGHPSFPHTGEFFAVGGGRIARVVLGVGAGEVSEASTAEDYARHVSAIMASTDVTVPSDRAAEFNAYMGELGYSGTVSRRLGRSG